MTTRGRTVLIAGLLAALGAMPALAHRAAGAPQHLCTVVVSDPGPGEGKGPK